MPLSKSSAYSIIVLFILVLVGFCVYSRQEVLARYHAWRLQSAPMDALDRYVLRFEQLTEPGMRAVVRLLHHSDPTVCTKASLTLTKLFPLWNDSDQHNCLQYIREQAVNFSSAGQQACLQLLHGFCETPSGSHQACQIMQSIMMASCQGSEHKQALLEFMNTLLLQENSAQHPQHNELVRIARNMVAHGLRDGLVPVRLAAIRLAVNPQVQEQVQLVPLLRRNTRDSSAEVRLWALLALGALEEILSHEDLCPLLLDEEAEVRLTAERVLKVRGWSNLQIRAARFLYDPQPAQRAQVPALLLSAGDTDTYAWVERLTRDDEPAVRVATARAMGQSGDDRLTSLLQKMAEQDVDPTVRELALFYWKQR